MACPDVLADSGANVCLATEELAKAKGWGISTDRAMPVSGTGANPTYTLGVVTAPIDLTFCMGTPGEITLRVPLHVIRGSSGQAWQLLLGTNVLNHIGGDVCTSSSQLLYRPALPHTPNSTPASALPTWSLPLTTSLPPCPPA